MGIIDGHSQHFIFDKERNKPHALEIMDGYVRGFIELEIIQDMFLERDAEKSGK
jgi:hypothetical protein